MENSKTINLYGKEISKKVFATMVHANNSHRIEGFVCLKCGRYNSLYKDAEEFAEHLTVIHKDDPMWDASKIVLEESDPTEPGLATVESEQQVVIMTPVVDTAQRMQGLRYSICLKLDELPVGVIGDASQQQIAFLLVGYEFSGSNTFAAWVGFKVNIVNCVETLQKVWNRILLSEMTYKRK